MSGRTGSNTALEGNEFGVDLVPIREEVVQVVTRHHVLPQRNGPVLFHDHFGVATHGGQPCTELFCVRHRRAQCGDDNLRRQVDDDLFPHRAPESIREVVDLVHHHVAEVVQRRGTCVQHVAKHLGCHDDDGRLAVDRRIAGQKPDGVPPVSVHQLGVLLVREGLDGCRIEALRPGLHSTVDRKFTHHGLAGSGRCGHEDPTARF